MWIKIHFDRIIVVLFYICDQYVEIVKLGLLKLVTYAKYFLYDVITYWKKYFF